MSDLRAHIRLLLPLKAQSLPRRSPFYSAHPEPYDTLFFDPDKQQLISKTLILTKKLPLIAFYSNSLCQVLSPSHFPMGQPVPSTLRLM